jgi:hypothetical protein
MKKILVLALAISVLATACVQVNTCPTRSDHWNQWDRWDRPIHQHPLH